MTNNYNIPSWLEETAKQVCPNCQCIKEYKDKYWYVNNFCNTCGHPLYWDEYLNGGMRKDKILTGHFHQLEETPVKEELKFKVKSIGTEAIEFENGYSLRHTYEPDCCEYNYADFTSLKDTVFEDMEYSDIVLEEASYGVLVNGHMINCYSDQNGYYSSVVEVYLADENGTKVKGVFTCGEVFC